MTGTAVAGSFNQIGQVDAANQGLVQTLLTALAPSVNADRSLNYQTAVDAARNAGVAKGSESQGMKLVHNIAEPALIVGGTALTALRNSIGPPPPDASTPNYLLNEWRFDDTLEGLLRPALNVAFADIPGNLGKPWLGWGATSATSTTYNYNLLATYTPVSGIFSVCVLGLTVTVNLSQQQLQTPGLAFSATHLIYTVTANVIAGLLTKNLQILDG